MAKLLEPAKYYYVDNCPCLVKTKDMAEDEHPEGFDDNPDMFLYELKETSYMNVDVPSNNNPVNIYLTGEIKV